MTETGVKTMLKELLMNFLGMALLFITILQPSSVYAGLDNHAEGPGATSLDKIVYLPLIARRFPPIPYPPDLAPITNVSAGNPYTLTWSILESTAPVQYYMIQADTEETFSNPQSYTCTTTTYTIPNAAAEIVYYRVRGHNVWGDGAWSNVEAIQFSALREDFNGHSGLDWHAKRTSSPDISLMTIGYDGKGNLETMVADKFDFAIFSPLVPAPPPPYHIQIRTQIIHKVNEVSYGIAFGGNVGTFCHVERAQAQDANGCFSHYYRLNVIWAGGYLKYAVDRIDGHDERGRGTGKNLRGFSEVQTGGPDDWHVWDIWVYQDRFGLGVDGQFIAWIYDTRYLNEPYFGIFSSTFEYNNAHFQHSYYHIFPIVSNEPISVQ